MLGKTPLYIYLCSHLSISTENFNKNRITWSKMCTEKLEECVWVAYINIYSSNSMWECPNIVFLCVLKYLCVPTKDKPM